jgi:hypothetical protein
MNELKQQLENLSFEELDELRKELDNLYEQKKEEKRRVLRRQMEDLAKSAGLTVAQVMKERPKQKRRRRVLQHPDDSSKVYRGGRKPDWLKSLEAAGEEPVVIEES